MQDALDLDTTLSRLVATGVELVRATYGALTVLGSNGRVLRVITDGVPGGSDQLVVPVTVGDVAFGHLSVTGENFAPGARTVLEALAMAAGIAVENADRYAESSRRQRWSEATSEIITQLLAGSDPTDALQAITDRTLELSSADYTLIAVPDDVDLPDEALSITVAAGFGLGAPVGLRLPINRSSAGAAFTDQVPRSVTALAFDPGFSVDLGPALVLPLRAGDQMLGVLVAARKAGAPAFDTHELPVIASFADQAALALRLASNQWHLRQLDVLADRDRIARDLHDHVIQRLFGVGLALQATQRRAIRPDVAQRISESIDQLHEIVSEIRTAIFDLHADTRGMPRLRQRLHGAIKELTGDGPLHTTVRLSGPLDLVPTDLAEQAEAVVREAVSNAVRHATAANLCVTVAVRDDLVIDVVDDGVGVPDTVVRRGLGNLRQRADRFGGAFTVGRASDGGTRLRWSVPLP
ncbi:MAG TPA: GAF domain-containing protein [Pseudonocardiaceae bacterium]|nr:GAF domain-containing protein [Pseudonocardiaceae bacterium]